MTRNQDAIRRLFRIARDSAGNLPPMPEIFPDYPVPVVRGPDDDRELVLMRWGMPSPPQIAGPPVTNHPQHSVAALAALAGAGKPLPGAGDKLRKKRSMRYSAAQHNKMADLLIENANRNLDPVQAKRQLALASVFRQSARKAAVSVPETSPTVQPPGAPPELKDETDGQSRLIGR